MINEIKQGDILLADLGGSKPLKVIVISNNTINNFSPTANVSAIVNTISEEMIPVHHKLNEGIVLTEQTRAISKERFINKIGSVSDSDLKEILRKHKINFYTDEEMIEFEKESA